MRALPAPRRTCILIVLAAHAGVLACGREAARVEPRAAASSVRTADVHAVERSSAATARDPSMHALASAPDGVLAGRIVDERGVARDLRLVLAPIGGSQAQRLAAQRRLSDLALDHGRFRFEGVPPGRYELTVFDELYGMSPVVIESDGRGLAGIALDVRPGVRVLVELGARGVVRVQDELGRSWHEREHDGTALFALFPGAYRLEARADEGAERALDFVVRDKPVRIDLRP